MNTKQEIVDAINRENKGAAPPALFTQTGTIEMMSVCGSSWPEANYSEDAMIRLALQPSELFGFATVRIPFDMTAEAERLGCEVFEGDNSRQPSVSNSPWKTGEIGDPPDLMPVDEFLSGGRPAMYIRTAERIAKEHPDLFLTSCTIGPVELAGLMVGFEEFIMGSFMNPDGVMNWVKKMTPYQCAYAEALSEASDNVFIITEGAEDVMDPDTFGTFTPYEGQVFTSIKNSFSTAHVCGITENILEKLAGLGSTILSVESHGDPQSVFDRVGDKVVLAGGIGAISTLLQGTPDDIRDAAWKAVDAGYHVIMSECGVPPQTPNVNLEALAKYRE